MKDTKNRLIVQSKGVGPKYEKQFFMEIQQAILDGWRIVDNNRREDVSMRNFRGRWGRAVFHKESEVEQVESSEVESTKGSVSDINILKEIQDAANKDALKNVAEKYNLEVDPNKKHPEALRKSLVAQVESN